ncbi:tail fiber protein [Acinetobacter johnsonii]|uniref:tail fiber protein n=1 Tax=Acinetobacter johnsonii TaxID=40214 RepID=UPI001D18BE7A|nr:tail fiber protein [Acinetobacter johnsonii]
MKRIDTINSRENMFGVGKNGFHDNADLPGQDATYVSPEWFNTVQEELCNLLELRGITLNPASKRQLYDLLTTQADLEALADEIETNFIRKNQIIDNLTTDDATKVASARTVKELQDKKLEASDLKDASTAQKGVVQLNNTLTSTSITQALTAAQAKELNDKMFGVSQSSKPATIISGTTYTNTKNKPITISVSMSGSSNNTASITIETHVLFSTNSSNLYIGSFTVGPGEDYKVTGNGITAIEFS